jgi:hypothetical protein
MWPVTHVSKLIFVRVMVVIYHFDASSLQFKLLPFLQWLRTEGRDFFLHRLKEVSMHRLARTPLRFSAKALVYFSISQLRE